MSLSRKHDLRSSLTTRLRALSGSDSGGALVELGVTLPIIFVIMTGVFAFSIAIYQKLALAEGVSAGARTLAADRGSDTDPCKTTASAIYAAAPSLSQSSLSLSFVINGTTTSGSTCSGTTLSAGTSAQVTATYPCTINMYGLKFSSCKLGAAVTENIQ